MPDIDPRLALAFVTGMIAGVMFILCVAVFGLDDETPR